MCKQIFLQSVFFECWRNNLTAFFFQKIPNLFFCYLIANNQLKCGIIYKEIAIRAGDDERITNYEWP